MMNFFLLLVSALQISKGQSPPPSPYIDKGACPFEGCAYRTWIAKKTIRLFSKPNSPKQIGLVSAGERVTGITGEVHSLPVLVRAAIDIPDPQHPKKVMIPKGGEYYLIHYLGEGAWLSWYEGHPVQVDHFSNHGPLPKATWWVEVRTKSGLTGWAISDNNFDGQDRLG